MNCFLIRYDLDYYGSNNIYGLIKRLFYSRLDGKHRMCAEKYSIEPIQFRLLFTQEMIEFNSELVFKQDII